VCADGADVAIDRRGEGDARRYSAVTRSRRVLQPCFVYLFTAERTYASGVTNLSRPIGAEHVRGSATDYRAYGSIVAYPIYRVCRAVSRNKVKEERYQSHHDSVHTRSE
jgi:hypothetical protein